MATGNLLIGCKARWLHVQDNFSYLTKFESTIMHEPPHSGYIAIYILYYILAYKGMNSYIATVYQEFLAACIFHD